MFLFTPSPTYRTRYVAVARRVPIGPEYPPVGARIDYYLASPSGEVKLEILDATGTVVRSFSSNAAPQRRRDAAAAAAAAGCRRRCRAKIGMNRFVWDLRYSGGPPSTGGEMEGGGSGGGPLVAPGSIARASPRAA